jgi:hypothetical protein
MVDGACMWVTDVTGSVLVGAAYVYIGGNGVRVVPGDYKVFFSDCGGGWASVWHQDADDAASATVVHVVEDPQSYVEQVLTPA